MYTVEHLNTAVHYTVDEISSFLAKLNVLGEVCILRLSSLSRDWLIVSY